MQTKLKRANPATLHHKTITMDQSRAFKSWSLHGFLGLWMVALNFVNSDWCFCYCWWTTMKRVNVTGLYIGWIGVQSWKHQSWRSCMCPKLRNMWRQEENEELWMTGLCFDCFYLGFLLFSQLQVFVHFTCTAKCMLCISLMIINCPSTREIDLHSLHPLKGGNTRTCEMSKWRHCVLNLQTRVQLRAWIVQVCKHEELGCEDNNRFRT